jgi:hypothetical protein
MFFPVQLLSIRRTSFKTVRVILFVLSMALLQAVADVSPRSVAHAWVPTRTQTGLSVKWKRASLASSFKMEFVGNTQNRSGLAASDLQASVIRGLQRWEKASGGALKFDYWQGTGSDIYETDSDYDGVSSIHFASAAPRDSVLPANVLGMTQVWFDTSTGEILETDIVLNDLQAAFTNEATDTTGYGNGRPSTLYAGTQKVFLENVLTHELGHAVGISHSGNLQSTMLYVESPEQAHLGCDDQLAFRALYPLASDSQKRGGLKGRVVGPDGKAVYGAQVSAISRARGVALHAVLTDREGYFEFQTLEVGTYYLLVEPFLGGAAVLPEFYEAVNTRLCANGREDFTRTAYFQAGSSHDLEALEVRADATVMAGTVAVDCEERAEAVRSSNGLIESDGDITEGMGFLDRLGWGEERVYAVGSPGADGTLRVHALGFSLFSPVRPVLALLDSSGRVVQGGGIQAKNPVFTGDSGYQNFDGELRASGLNPAATYFLRVRGSYVDSFRVPGGPEAIDIGPFVVLVVSRGLQPLPLASEISDHARCAMSESFRRYASPARAPVRKSTEAALSAGGCTPAAVADFAGRVKAPRSPLQKFGDACSSLLPYLIALVGVRLLVPRRYSP